MQDADSKLTPRKKHREEADADCSTITISVNQDHEVPSLGEAEYRVGVNTATATRATLYDPASGSVLAEVTEFDDDPEPIADGTPDVHYPDRTVSFTEGDIADIQGDTLVVELWSPRKAGE